MPIKKSLFSAVFAAIAGVFATTGAFASDRELTVYTYESFVAEWGPGPVVKKAFEAQCDCTLNWVGIADGVALLNRLKLEGEATRADVVLGLDTNLVTEAKETGLFEPSGIDQSNVTVPGNWSDDVFIPYDYGYFAVVYDTDALANPPASLKELVEGDTNVKIAIQDPRTSTPGLGLLLWIKSVYGDEAPAAWKGLKQRVLTVTPGWSESYGLFTAGEVPMVLSYTTSPAYHMIAEDTDRYRAAAFEEGHYLQIEVAGLVNTSKQKDLARQFLEFMTGPQFQNAIPTTNWMFPAGKMSEPLPAAFDELVQPDKTLLFSADEVARNRKAWVEEWLNVMSD
ncbi:thiamine ABC transporter substrate binding subunit [Hoeflea sp.]|uniref:thiamine ABC transporter substrate binding subunit n=1 Tax=Hoeflea sp. TaxID=1940281 RepID=UPI003B019AF9